MVKKGMGKTSPAFLLSSLVSAPPTLPFTVEGVFRPIAPRTQKQVAVLETAIVAGRGEQTHWLQPAMR